MVTNILTTDPHVQVCRIITPASKNAVKWELDWSRRLKGKQEWKQIKKAKSESTLLSDLEEEEYENIPEVLIQELIYWREMYTTCQCFKQALGCSKNNVVLMMMMESITSRCASLIQMYLVTIETWNSNCLLLGLVIFNSVWKSQECFELLR
uniref:Uncharacterized protein n=1 Tax=Biomphalaria glabrata TaxID=6526 RepID=A0A2C9L5T7_BIOGL